MRKPIDDADGTLTAPCPCATAPAASRTLRAFVDSRQGAIVVMAALLMPILVGAIGLGVEVGLWFQQKRSLQTMADAAAIAAVY